MNIEVVFMSNLAFYIFQAKWMLCLARGIGIFAWTEKKIEGHPNAINGGLITSRFPVAASSAARKSMIIGTGSTRDGGLSSFFQAENI